MERLRDYRDRAKLTHAWSVDVEDLAHSVHAELPHEALNPILVHHDLAHLVSSLVGVEEGLGGGFVVASGGAGGGATARSV